MINLYFDLGILLLIVLGNTLTVLFGYVLLYLYNKYEEKHTTQDENTEDTDLFSVVSQLISEAIKKELPIDNIKNELVTAMHEELQALINEFPNLLSPLLQVSEETQSEADNLAKDISMDLIQENLPPAVIGLLKKYKPNWKEDFMQNPEFYMALYNSFQQFGGLGLLQQFGLANNTNINQPRLNNRSSRV